MAEVVSSEPHSTNKCPTCGDEFETEGGMKVHHTTIHGESIAGKEVGCSYCGQTLRRKPYHVRRNDHFFCEDKRCYQKWQSENVCGENHHQYNRVTVVCDWCNSELIRHPCEIEEGGRNFCNHSDCYANWISENKNGSDSPRWKEITTENIYRAIRNSIGDLSWYMRRSELGEQYDTCEVCGNDENINIHHIIPILSGGTNEDWNLMALCKSCHGVVERYTDRFTDCYFNPDGHVTSISLTRAASTKVNSN